MNQESANIIKVKISIRSKMILSFIVVILFCAALVGAYVFNLIKNREIKLNESGFINIASYQIDILENNFSRIENLVEYLAKDDTTVDFLSGNIEYNRYKSYLNNLDALNQFDAIYVMDAKGKTLASTQIAFEGNNYSFRDYFNQANLDSVYITTGLGITSNEMGYYFSYPIYSKNDKSLFLGVAVIKIGQSQIENLFLQRQDVDFSILDNESIYIFSTNQSLVLKSMESFSRLNKFIGIKESKYLGKEIVSLARDNDWKKIMNSNSNIVSFYSNDLENINQKTLYISKKLNNSDFYLLLTVNESKIFGSIDQFSYNIFISIILTAILAILILILIINLILSPMKKIEELIGSILNGNYKNEEKIKSRDEFQVIENMLINMQNNIENRIYKAKLEAKQTEDSAKKKMSELEKLNELMINREMEIINYKKKIKELDKLINKS